MSFKTLTLEDLKAVQWIQNVSGGIAYLGDLSEDGKEGKGVTLQPDDILELKTVVSDDSKVRSKALKKGLEGFAGDRSSPPQKPYLQIISGPNDPRIIKTAVKGTTLSTDSPTKRAVNVFDVALMEQNLKDLNEELETTQDSGKRATLQVTIDMMTKSLAEQRLSVPSGMDANVVQVPTGAPAPTGSGVL